MVCLSDGHRQAYNRSILYVYGDIIIHMELLYAHCDGTDLNIQIGARNEILTKYPWGFRSKI